LKALLKLEFSWKDTFRVHPLRGSAAHGYPTQWIPAELTGTFQTMAEREMDIMSSPNEAEINAEIYWLVAVTVSFGFFFALGLFLTICTQQVILDEVKDDDWRMDEPWLLIDSGSSETVTKNGNGHDRQNGKENGSLDLQGIDVQEESKDESVVIVPTDSPQNIHALNGMGPLQKCTVVLV
jgi:hypothetical protein